MICPLMSRPVVFEDKLTMFEQPCIKQDCPLWIVDYLIELCGLTSIAVNLQRIGVQKDE